MATEQKWQNRIVGYTVKPARDFLANPLNWRVHPKGQQAALRGVLGEVGWVQCAVENITTGHLIDGHLRVLEAMRISDDEPVPCLQVEVDEAEEPYILTTLDPIGAMAAADKANLELALRETSSGDAAVQEMLAELAAKEGITPPNVEFPEYTEDVEKEVEFITCPECGHKWPK